ncbi:MAG: argininosuccinate synthase domain-containing protein [Vicinamibacterales bacterium]
MTARASRVVLASSGGQGLGHAIAAVRRLDVVEIVTMTLDVGQGGELGPARQRALEQGAIRAHVLDVREEFARDYVGPTLRADALSPGGRPWIVELTWPLLARHLVRVAQMEGANAVAFRAKDPHPLRAAVSLLDPALTCLTFRDVGTEPVGDALRATLWGRLFAPGDPWEPAPEVGYTLTKAGPKAADTPAHLEISFEQGMATRVNGVTMGFTELLASVGTIAGAHAVGRFDVLDRDGDRVTRAVGEAPAAVVLHAAHRDLQAFVTPGDLNRLSSNLAGEYGRLIADGRWFTPSRDAIDAFTQSVQTRVTGTVRLRLFKGTCTVVGRRLEHEAAGPSRFAG